METRILSQDAVKRYECNVPHIVVSIRDSWEPSFPLPDNQKRLGALRLQFDDVNKEHEEFSKRTGMPITVFNEEMAKQIKEFVLKYPEAETFIVNCYMGISRSAAVAKALYEWKPDVYESGLRLSHNPNPLVYKILLETLKAI